MKNNIKKIIAEEILKLSAKKLVERKNRPHIGPQRGGPVPDGIFCPEGASWSWSAWGCVYGPYELPQVDVYGEGKNRNLKEQNPVTGMAFGAGGEQQRVRGAEYWAQHPAELAKRLGISQDDVPEHLAFWQAELEAEGCRVDLGQTGAPSPTPLPAADRRAMGM